MNRWMMISAIFTLFLQAAPPMPPMLPGMSIKATKSKQPKSCQDIPPMLFRLPPPLESSLEKCKNQLSKPTLLKAKKLFGSSVVSIDIAKGFSKIYIIALKKDKKLTKLYCNQNLSLCFDNSPKSYTITPK